MQQQMIYDSINGDRTTPARVRLLRFSYAVRSVRAARRLLKALGRSEGNAWNARAKAEVQTASPSPQPRRLVCSSESFRSARNLLSSESVPGAALADRLTNSQIESLGIVHRLSRIVLPVVVAEHLFVQVAELVEWFRGNVCSVQAAPEDTPEGFGLCINGLKAEPDSLKHEPGGLVSDAQVACDLVGTESVLVSRGRPNCGKQPVQTERRVFKKGAAFDRELTLRMRDSEHRHTLRSVS